MKTSRFWSVKYIKFQKKNTKTAFNSSFSVLRLFNTKLIFLQQYCHWVYFKNFAIFRIIGLFLVWPANYTHFLIPRSHTHIISSVPNRNREVIFDKRMHET